METLAHNGRLDTAALYSECLLSLAQRAAQTEALKAERDREVARV